jgi:hypothetical protein
MVSQILGFVDDLGDFHRTEVFVSDNARGWLS